MRTPHVSTEGQSSTTLGSRGDWVHSTMVAVGFIAIALILNACAAAPAGTPQPPLVSVGERIARENCGACHAMTADAASPLPDAPSFPKLRARYDRDAMALVIAERMEVLHPRMPRLQLDIDEVPQFLDYWESLEPARTASQDAAKPQARMSRAVTTP